MCVLSSPYTVYSLVPPGLTVENIQRHIGLAIDSGIRGTTGTKIRFGLQTDEVPGQNFLAWLLQLKTCR